MNSEFPKGDHLTLPVSPRRATEVLVVLTIMVIAMGGMIRIYDAGESCPDWPTCFGTFGSVSYTHLTLPTTMLV